jgi:hypothetical protein
LHPQNLKGEKSMKRFVIAITLTFVISGSTLAGEIPTVGFTAPPPPPDGLQATNTSAPGEIPSVGLTQQMSEAAFSLIQLLIGAVA